MITLAQINETLQNQNMILRAQGVNIESTVTGIVDVKNKISELIEAITPDQYDQLEQRRENGGQRGNGLSGVIPFGLPSQSSMPNPDPGSGDPPPLPVSSGENFFNNLFGGIAGGAITGGLFKNVGKSLGKGLKIGAIALVADQVLNSVFENLDLTDKQREEIEGDANRSITGAAIGAFFKKTFAGLAAGYFFDDIRSIVKDSSIASLVDPYTKQIGLSGTDAVTGTVAVGGGIAAQKALSYIPSAAKYVGGQVATGAKIAGGTVARYLPVAASKLGIGGSSLIAAAKPMLTPTAMATAASTVAPYVPLAAVGATIGLFGTAISKSEQLRDLYPDLRALNNGRGLGYVDEKDIIDNGLLDKVVAEAKRNGTYKPPPRYFPTSKTPLQNSMMLDPSTITTPKDVVTFLPPSQTAPSNNDALKAYLANPAGSLATGNSSPQITVIPIPIPAPAPSSSGSNQSSSSIVTMPVQTVDRLDNGDRISRSR